MGSNFTIRATGDVFLDTDDPFSLLAEVAPLLQEADLTIANLEGPCSSRGTPLAEKAVFDGGIGGSIRMPPHAVEAVKRAGVDVVSLANNHGMDFGEEALLDTLDLVEEHGIAYAGGGRDLQSARAPAYVEANGARVAFLSYTSLFTPVAFPATETSPGLACVRIDTSYEIPSRIAAVAPGAWARARTQAAPEDRELVLEEVQNAKQNADFVVVGYHWGISGHGASKAMGIPSSQTPTAVADYQEEMGRAIIDAGAVLVIGHHPHRMQGFEAYKHGLISYSLGNLAFSFARPHFDPRTCILEVNLTAGRDAIQGARLIPVTANEATLVAEPVGPEGLPAFVPYLTDLSVKYETQFKLSEDQRSVHITT